MFHVVKLCDLHLLQNWIIKPSFKYFTKLSKKNPNLHIVQNWVKEPSTNGRWIIILWGKSYLNKNSVYLLRFWEQNILLVFWGYTYMIDWCIPNPKLFYAKRNELHIQKYLKTLLIDYLFDYLAKLDTWLLFRFYLLNFKWNVFFYFVII